MMYSNRRRQNIFRIAIIALLSLLSLLFFQNCGGVQSQSSTASSTAGNSTNGNGTSPAPAPSPVPAPTAPPPAPVPAPAPGTSLLPQTAALRESLCNPFINTSGKASFLAAPALPASVALNSSSGNGANAAGNGDTANNTVQINFSINPGVTGNIASSQNIVPPAQYVQSPLISCGFATALTVEVATGVVGGVDYTPNFSKAVDVDVNSGTYGQNIAAGATAAQMSAIANRAVDFTANSINPVVGTSGVLGVNLQRNAQGLRCVQGHFYLKLSLRTQVENSNMTSAYAAGDTNYRYVRVNMTDTCWNELRLAGPVAPTITAGYGSQVAASSNWIAVMAPKDTGIVGGSPVAGSGTVTMFRRNGASWDYCQKITLPNAIANTAPITSVALSEDNKLVIGNANTSENGVSRVGEVHIYSYDSAVACVSGNPWVPRQVIRPSTWAGSNSISANANQYFGISTALSNNYLVVGAFAANSNNGAVYVYNCAASSCTYSYAIANSVGSSAGFGMAVALSGNALVVGAPQAVGYEADGDGFANIYDVSVVGGSYRTRLRPLDITSETSTSMRFGDAVAVLGNRVVVGAPNRGFISGGAFLAASGAAYYYNFGSSVASVAVDAKASVIKRITGPNTANAFVGRGVALTSDGVVVGQDGNTSREGRAAFYTDTRMSAAAASHAFGTNDYNLFGLNKTGSNDFGYSIAVSDKDIVVGARIKASPNNAGGAVYVLKRP